TIPSLPGVSFDFNTARPSPDQQDDESVVYRRAIAVSPMQAGYSYRSGEPALTSEAIAALLPGNPE
ncbi:MAG: acid phosphatase, partial [Erythrobacter sp.]|nr:acid phosphatase [Erythrobacter sp.]